MPMHTLAALPLVEIVAPVVIALLFIGATSAFREPHRQHFMAIMLAGAGAAYLNGGLGLWEFAFTAVMTSCAYQGLSSYRWIGLGWLLHPAWDARCVIPSSPYGVLLVRLPSLPCGVASPSTPVNPDAAARRLPCHDDSPSDAQP